MTHDHIALRAMLAEQCAADTIRDDPPLLFALLHDPENGYGIAPLRPWTDIMHEGLKDHPPQVVLPALVDMAQRHLAAVPGLNAAQAALDLCLGKKEMRTSFPGVTERSRACGIVYRTEEWAAPAPADGSMPEMFSLSQHPERIELVTWRAVCEDDTYHQVAWVKGKPQPFIDHFAFSDERYDPRRWAMATHLRGLMRVNRRAARYNFETGQYEKPGKAGAS